MAATSLATKPDTLTVDAARPVAFRELAKPYRYKAFHGGRGSAKSHSFAQQLLLDAVQSPLRIVCGREVQQSIKQSVKRLLDDKINTLGLQAFYHSLDQEIRGANGSHFSFVGLSQMSVDQVKSMEGVDRFWGEEAQTFSKRSMEVLIPTIRKPGSELWFSWNPRHASDPVDKRFRGLKPPPNSLIRAVTFRNNPFFTPELEAERAYDEANNRDRYGHIWEGDYEPKAVGAIWDRVVLHESRRATCPPVGRTVVAVDPATTSPETNSTGQPDYHGIVVCAEGEDGRGYVLEDASLQGTPNQWAQRAISTYDRWEADAIIVEVNQGGDMVKNTLTAVRPNVPVREVRATRGKHVRAAPISALYHVGRISHVGTFTYLEDQMVKMTDAGYEGDDSPDRVDALVWGLTYLFPKLTTPQHEDEDDDREYDMAGVEGGWMAG